MVVPYNYMRAVVKKKMHGEKNYSCELLWGEVDTLKIPLDMREFQYNMAP